MQISLQAKNAALTVLRSAFEQTVQTQAPKSDENLVATLNNTGGSAQAKAGLAEDLFSVHHMDVAQMKVRIFEKLGEKFGLKQEDFESLKAYARAIQRGVENLKDKPGGLLALQKIEEDLGLDELGISIDKVIDAMIDPTGDAAKELNEALSEKIGKFETSKKAIPIKLDEDGLYKR